MGRGLGEIGRISECAVQWKERRRVRGRVQTRGDSRLGQVRNEAICVRTHCSAADRLCESAAAEARLEVRRGVACAIAAI